jgi:hypothetical protein
MAEKRRTDAEAIEQSPHVLYEIQMLGALRDHFLKGDHDRAVAALPLEGLASRNALVEAFQIHARQLIDFLTDKPAAKEATAHDYATGSWSIPAGDAKALRRLGGEFSQRVAHLSWRRSGDKSVQTAVLTEEIFAAIRKHLLAFLDRVDPERVEDDFVEEARKALAESKSAVDFFKAAVPSAPGALASATVSLSPDSGGTATHMIRPEPE